MMQFHGAPPSLLTSLPSMKKSTCFIVALEDTVASHAVPSMILLIVWPLSGALNVMLGAACAFAEAKAADTARLQVAIRRFIGDSLSSYRLVNGSNADPYARAVPSSTSQKIQGVGKTL